MKGHGWELAALWSLATLIIVSMVWLAYESNGEVNSSHGVVIAGLAPMLAVAFNSIRGLGQSRAMQSMADQLGRSAPVGEAATGQGGDPVHVADDTEKG